VLVHELRSRPSCGATDAERIELGDGQELLGCAACRQGSENRAAGRESASQPARARTLSRS
jgi:hypothetical protein